MSSENKNSHPQRDGSSRGTTLVPRQQTLPAGALISCDALANGGRVRRSLLGVPESGYLRSVRGSGGIFVGTFRVCFHHARLAGRPFPATRLRRSRCRFDSRSTPRGRPHGGPPHHGPRKIRLVQGKGEVKGKTRAPKFKGEDFRWHRATSASIRQGRLYAQLDVTLKRLGYGTAVLGRIRCFLETGAVYPRDATAYIQSAGGHLPASLHLIKGDRGADLQLLRRSASLAETVRERHGEASSVG